MLPARIKFVLRFPSLGVLMLIAMLAVASPAAAEIRAGSSTDPAEVPADVNGQFERDDITRVTAVYDTDGAAQIVLGLPRPVLEDSASRFVIAFGTADVSGGCDSSVAGGVTLDFNLEATTFTAAVVAKAGRARGTLRRAPDGRVVYADVEAPGLRMLGVNCVTQGLLYTENDDYSEFCEPEFESCAPESTVLDDTAGFALAPGGAFDEPPLPPIPTLSKSDAGYYVGQALVRRFKGAYRYKGGYRRRCGRASRLRVRCRVSWFVGDGYYSGKVTIWHARDPDDPTQTRWNYAYTIRLLDTYCRYVTKGKHCTTTYRAR